MKKYENVCIGAHLTYDLDAVFPGETKLVLFEEPQENSGGTSKYFVSKQEIRWKVKTWVEAMVDQTKEEMERENDMKLKIPWLDIKHQ